LSSSSSVEAALQALASASSEVRHTMLLAALSLSDADRAPRQKVVASSRIGRSGIAKRHSREAQERLWGLVLRGRDGKSDASADVWTDYYFQQAQERGLLDGFQL
jgi:hypothetical protein